MQIVQKRHENNYECTYNSEKTITIRKRPKWWVNPPAQSWSMWLLAYGFIDHKASLIRSCWTFSKKSPRTPCRRKAFEIPHFQFLTSLNHNDPQLGRRMRFFLSWLSLSPMKKSIFNAANCTASSRWGALHSKCSHLHARNVKRIVWFASFL